MFSVVGLFLGRFGVYLEVYGGFLGKAGKV